MMNIKVCTDESMYLWSTDSWEPYKLVRAYQIDGDAPGVYSGHEVLSGEISSTQALNKICTLVVEENVKELEQTLGIEDSLKWQKQKS